MIKQEANNSFAEGLMMDMNPLTTPNTVMTNCLNGTLITFNGNEYILQNDMGNGRVETAYLPEGYIPMGTCELGGIIYIVSYNPLKGTCLIGSFPSPERNISSDEILSPEVVLSNADFQFDGDSGAKVYYLKKELDTALKIYPGDKFIVYSNDLHTNASNIRGLSSDDTNSIVKLSLGTVTSDGKLVIFDSKNLKKFNIIDDKKYHIAELDIDDQTGRVDLDDYRNLVELPYNIFTSNVSGTLVLVAELISFDTFSAEIFHVTDGNTYTPKLSLNFSGNDKFIPYAILKEFKLILNNEVILDLNTLNYKFNENDLKEEESDGLYKVTTSNKLSLLDIKDIIGSNEWGNLKLGIPKDYFYKPFEERDPYILEYTITPCMSWGPVKHLAIKGSIALNRVGSTYVDINQWRYYNSDTTCNLSWGLEAYTEDEVYISGVNMEFIGLDTDEEDNIISVSMDYKIDKKASYHSSFLEIIPFNEDYYRFSNINDKNSPKSLQLKSNTLYLVKITVKFEKETQLLDVEEKIDPKTIYRWMYTNAVFNDKYLNIFDYDNQHLPIFEPTIEFSYTHSLKLKDLKITYGTTRREATEEKPSLEGTLSYINNTYLNKVSCEALVKFKDNFNTFRAYIENFNSDDITIELNQNEIDFSVSSKKIESQSTGNNLDDAKDILSDKEGDTYFINENCTKTDLIIIDSLLPKFSFNINYDTVAKIKVCADLYEQVCTATGIAKPLAYDIETFAKYGLDVDKDRTIDNGKGEHINFIGTHWFPRRLGAYWFFERKNRDGKVHVGKFTNENKVLTDEVAKSNNVNLDWIYNSKIKDALKNHGWDYPLMFVTHSGCTETHNDGTLPRQDYIEVDTFNHPINKYATTINGITKNPADVGFSNDSYLNNTRNVVHVFIKDNNGTYYPINCALSIDRPSGFERKIEYWWSLYDHIATILNNIYWYSEEITTKSYYIPEDIYYSRKDTYITNIPIDFEFDLDIKVALEINGKPILISSNIIKKFTESSENISDNNITSSVLKKGISTNIIINTSDDSSYKILMEKLEEDKSQLLESIVCDFDGKENPDLSFKKANTTIYCREGNKVIPATYFNPYDLLYSLTVDENNLQKLEITQKTDLEETPFRLFDGYSKSEEDTVPSDRLAYLREKINGDRINLINLTKLFTIDTDGNLLVKDPSGGDFKMKRWGGAGKGIISGFLDKILSPLYRFWYKN